MFRMGEKKLFERSVFSKKASFMYTLAIYLCFVLLFHWIYFILPMHQPFLICIMFVHIFLTFIDYFKIFSIN